MILVRETSSLLQSYFLRFYLFNFRERGREGEVEGENEKGKCVVASRIPPAGLLVHNPGLFPNWELNPLPFGLQAGTQSTELHQPRLYKIY